MSVYELLCTTCMWWEYRKNEEQGYCNRFGEPRTWDTFSCEKWVDYKSIKIEKENKDGR